MTIDLDACSTTTLELLDEVVAHLIRRQATLQETAWNRRQSGPKR